MDNLKVPSKSTAVLSCPPMHVPMFTIKKTDIAAFQRNNVIAKLLEPVKFEFEFEFISPNKKFTKETKCKIKQFGMLIRSTEEPFGFLSQGAP